ncbi:MAG: hypothetical protein K2W85_01340 [Phycisphaerales bacterium]|nr:hypothetical protein [Phycisphaerales bacterium]
MIALKPEIVRFEDQVWEDVQLVAVDQVPHKLIEEFGDQGPYAEFVDVPERSVLVRVVRRVTRDEANDLPLGSAGTLRFYIGPGTSDAGRKRVDVQCVLTSIRAGAPESAAGSTNKTMTFVGAASGGTNPITMTDATLGD